VSDYKPLPPPTAKAFKRVRKRFKREYGYEAPYLVQHEAYFGPDHPQWPNRRFPVILVLSGPGDVTAMPDDVRILACYTAIGDFVDDMPRDESPLH
jgi:hypothetical protein